MATDHPQDVGDMVRVQAGDRGALANLYDRHTPLLLGVARRILGSESDAEDVLQDLWLQVWRQAERYSSGRGSVASWLVTIARTRALDRRRRAAARSRAEALGAPAAAQGGATNDRTTAESLHLGEQVRKALAALEPKQRESLEIAYFEGLTQSEVAERLQIPLGTVKTWMRRGLARLRTLLKEAHHG